MGQCFISVYFTSAKQLCCLAPELPHTQLPSALASYYCGSNQDTSDRVWGTNIVPPSLSLECEYLSPQSPDYSLSSSLSVNHKSSPGLSSVYLEGGSYFNSLSLAIKIIANTICWVFINYKAHSQEVCLRSVRVCTRVRTRVYRFN